MSPLTGPYRFTYWREPDLSRRCENPHPAFPATTCNRTRGHDGSHRHTSPVDGRSIEWTETQDVFA